MIVWADLNNSQCVIILFLNLKTLEKWREVLGWNGVYNGFHMFDTGRKSIMATTGVTDN